MRGVYMVSVEFESPEIGTLTVKKGGKIMTAYANSEAYEVFKKLVNLTDFEVFSDEEKLDGNKK